MYTCTLILQAFLGVVSRNVDVLEECVSKAEKELDPSKLRKVFSSLPKLVRWTVRGLFTVCTGVEATWV